MAFSLRRARDISSILTARRWCTSRVSSSAGESAGGFDEVAGTAGEAGQHVVDHRRVGRAGIRQVDGPFPSAVYSVKVLGPWPVNPALIAYSSTAPVKVARQPPRIP
jgi:hypothetical protein